MAVNIAFKLSLAFSQHYLLLGSTLFVFYKLNSWAEFRLYCLCRLHCTFHMRWTVHDALTWECAPNPLKNVFSLK